VRIGWNGGGHHSQLESIRDEARRAATGGFASFWLSQITGPDALTALGAVAADAPGIELGTSIVPVYGRHPITLAAQALTAQAATGGRVSTLCPKAEQTERTRAFLRVLCKEKNRA
jgi:alkanesulfonate monooxygenase SsuD/methylene tetrahydromethanopterin reductase-like flavin-dependent oxidoreductase (luciferase family)